MRNSNPVSSRREFSRADSYAGAGTTRQSDSAAITPSPAEPLPYHRLALMNGRHQWWRPLTGTGFVLAGAVLAALAVILGGEVVDAAVDRPGGADGSPAWNEIGNNALNLLMIAVVIPIVLLAAQRQRRPAGTVSSVAGTLRWRWLGQCFAVALPISVTSLATTLMLPLPADSDTEVAWAGLSPFLVGLATVWVLVPFQAAAEEYLFRGWLVQAVGSWCRSPWVAVAPQAVLFAAAHGWGTPWGFADLVVFGLVAGLLTVRTGGLEAAIALHAITNLLPMSLASAFAGGLGSDETAADMNWTMVAVDVPMLVLYAAVILWLARRRHTLKRFSYGQPAEDKTPSPSRWRLASDADEFRERLRLRGLGNVDE